MDDVYQWRDVATDGPPDGEPVLVFTADDQYAVLVWWEEPDDELTPWTEPAGAPWRGREPVWWFPLPPCKPGVVWVPKG